MLKIDNNIAKYTPIAILVLLLIAHLFFWDLSTRNLINHAVINLIAAIILVKKRISIEHNEFLNYKQREKFKLRLSLFGSITFIIIGAYYWLDININPEYYIKGELPLFFILTGSISGIVPAIALVVLQITIDNLKKHYIISSYGLNRWIELSDFDYFIEKSLLDENGDLIYDNSFFYNNYKREYLFKFSKYKFWGHISSIDSSIDKKTLIKSINSYTPSYLTPLQTTRYVQPKPTVVIEKFHVKYEETDFQISIWFYVNNIPIDLLNRFEVDL